MRNKILYLTTFIIIISFLFSGCVNVTQKTTIYKDGSGIIKLEYWTKMNNLKGVDELGGFTFKSEEDVKANYTSSSVTVTSIKKEDQLSDSTTHVFVEMSFKDFNSLNSTKGYFKIQTSWLPGSNGMEFKYVIPQDTSNAKTYGASDYKLNYEFEFPGQVISSNGRKDGVIIYWDKTLADLKNDLEFKATIKSDEK